MSVDPGPTRKARLPLNKLRFGSIDARNEVVTRDPKSVEHFRESFLQPSGISVSEFIKGERFFISGMKGSGKTAFLRYVQLIAEDDRCLTKFVAFAQEISDSERISIYESSKIVTYEQKDIDPGRECVSLWIIFILRHLVRLIEDNRRVFSSHNDVKLLCELIKRTYEGEEKGVLSWLSSALKRGKYKVKSPYFEATISGKSTDAQERDYTIEEIIRQAFSLLRNLSWEGIGGLFIFFDELNLSFVSKEQHTRDAILIRDLVIAVDRVNSVMIELEKPVYVLAAVRAEVLNALRVPTNEINKILADRGRELKWFAATASAEWPIANLFERKVRASEKVNKHTKSDDVFKDYFFRDVFGMPARSLIVELTWCNPRDLVLLFGKAAEQAEDEPYFGEQVLGRAFDYYGAEAWREKTEELTVEYHPTEVQSIKKILLNFRQHFKYDQFERHAKEKSLRNKQIENLVGKRSMIKILEDLYRIGVIGQSTSRQQPRDTGTAIKQFREHWTYRGDKDFDQDAWMIVHRALWPELRLGRVRAGDQFASVPRSAKLDRA